MEQIGRLHPYPIKYCGGRISRSARTLTLNFITDVAPLTETVQRITDIIKSNVPDSFLGVEVNVKKIVTQPEFVAKSALSYLRNNHSIFSNAIDSDHIFVEINGNNVLLKINVESSVYSYFTTKNVQAELENYLETQFVDTFTVILSDVGESEVDESSTKLKLTENDLRTKYVRTLKVDDVTRLFDNDDTCEASYISDTKDFLGFVYLAGVVTNIRELKTKNDKTFYIIEFNDRTGTASGKIFPSKDKISKIQKLAVGSEIIVSGTFEMFNGYHSLTIKAINYCSFPKNFVPAPRPKRPVPKEYSLVFPQKLVLENQTNFLEEDSVPECFNGRTFVVFDLETTGTELDDKITEIGAVRIEDGKIVSYFETLVNPQKHIRDEIVNLTGIDDDMVKDAPVFENVCADFYKYCDGATLVAHNVDFDSRFIRRQSEPLDYFYDHPLMDTLALGREVITGVSNYKLNTLCDKFGIVFNHHRAYSDALACAKLLIEIIKIRKEFPF